ncbi:MAG: ComEC/Rec2 family competence protein, partial [Opitutales bacterium]
MDIRTQLSQRAPALYVLPGMICGLLLARAAPAESAVAFTALALGLISWLLARREQPKLWLLAFMASSALGFWFYGSVHLPPRPDAELLSVPPREAVLSLKIVRVMQPENKFGKSTGIARVLAASATSRVQKNSLIYFRLSREDTGELEIMRGLTFEVKGVLLPISGHVAPDSFDAYLKDTGIHYRMEQTTASRILKPASSFMSLCHETNIRFQEILRLGEPPGTELSQIYIAMLLGQKTQLSQEQKERFRITGTMHLFAISGLHIGAIATVIWQMLLLCRLPPKMTPFLGLPLLYFYVEVTGGTPSAIRAFLMV